MFTILAVSVGEPAALCALANFSFVTLRPTCLPTSFTPLTALPIPAEAADPALSKPLDKAPPTAFAPFLAMPAISTSSIFCCLYSSYKCAYVSA